MMKQAHQNARFLIVDDELVNVLVLEQMLNDWNCWHICSTTRSTEAVSLFADFQPDIVLLDLMMPELDGFQIMERLRPLVAPDDFVPFLVLTADTTIPTKHKALSLGATDFLTKPFDIVELELRLSNLIERRFLHHQLRTQNLVLDEKVQERTRELQRSESETIECLAMAAEYRDDDTGQHTQRVGQMAALLAQQLGLSEEHASLIRRAAPLHDVGKIGISDAILLKAGKLTPEEFDVMRSHATIGSRILRQHHTPLLQLAADIALTHHEKWDGTGYPSKLEGNNIPLEGQIVAVADVFDALTHERPYKAAWPVSEAIAEIVRQSGRQFSPAIVAAFLRVSQSPDVGSTA